METKIGDLSIDESLIKSIEKGEETSILLLYDASFSVLMNVVVRYKKNHEDRVSLINNAFMKVILHIREFNVGTSYVAWIKTILKREIIDDFRRNKRRYLEISMADLPDEARYIFKTETIWNDPNWDIKDGTLSYTYKGKSYQRRLD